MKCELLTCPLGTILDFSESGLRMKVPTREKLKPNQVIPLTLQSEGIRLSLWGRICWVKRRSLKHVEVGVEFVQMKPIVATALQNLARFGYLPNFHAMREGRSSEASVVRSGTPAHYKTLDISPVATEEMIHKAYRALARKFHPDVNRSPDAAANFDRITKAYHVLRDPALRRQYDIHQGVRTERKAAG